MATDESWAPAARAARAALEALAGPGMPRCLPDEDDPCSGNFSQHAAAYYGNIKAIADHQLSHLGQRGTELAEESYGQAMKMHERTCSREHA